MSNELTKQNQPYNLFKDPRTMRLCRYCGQDLYHSLGCPCAVVTKRYIEPTALRPGYYSMWQEFSPILESQLAPEKDPNE